MTYYFNNIERFDLFFKNPNATALFLLGIIVIFLLIRNVFFFGYLLDIIILFLFYYLLDTCSRGGVLSTFVFLMVLITSSLSKSVKKYYFVIIFLFAIIYCFHPSIGRLLLAPKDTSVINRLEIWKHSFSMICDAPYGWGIGKSGNAYMNFYQNIIDCNIYKTLVNSHLTVLVEVPWYVRLIYILFWFSIFFYLYPKNGKNCDWICYAYLVAFFVSCFFSSFYHYSILLVLPGICVLYLCAVTFRNVHEISLYPLSSALILTFCIFILVFYFRKDTGVSRSSEFTTIGDGKFNVLIIPNEKVMGIAFGKRIRNLAYNFPSVRFWIPNFERDSSKISTDLIVASDMPNLQLPDVHNIILLNPLKNYNKIEGDLLNVYHGEFSISKCKNRDLKNNHITLEGVGNFIPFWDEIVAQKLIQIMDSKFQHKEN